MSEGNRQDRRAAKAKKEPCFAFATSATNDDKVFDRTQLITDAKAIAAEGLDPEIYIGIFPAQLGTAGNINKNEEMYIPSEYEYQVNLLNERAKISLQGAKDGHPGWTSGGKLTDTPCALLSCETYQSTATPGLLRAQGRFGILNTSTGRDLLVLMKAGMQIGISHRGYAYYTWKTMQPGNPYYDMNKAFDGREYAERHGFELVTFDIVDDPANETWAFEAPASSSPSLSSSDFRKRLQEGIPTFVPFVPGSDEGALDPNENTSYASTQAHPSKETGMSVNNSSSPSPAPASASTAAAAPHQEPENVVAQAQATVNVTELLTQAQSARADADKLRHDLVKAEADRAVLEAQAAQAAADAKAQAEAASVALAEAKAKVAEFEAREAAEAKAKEFKEAIAAAAGEDGYVLSSLNRLHERGVLVDVSAIAVCAEQIREAVAAANVTPPAPTEAIVIPVGTPGVTTPRDADAAATAAAAANAAASGTPGTPAPLNTAAEFSRIASLHAALN